MERRHVSDRTCDASCRMAFGLRLIHEGQPLKESLQIITLATGIPAFLLMAAWNRLSQETIGVILAGVIGFALGKFG